MKFTRLKQLRMEKGLTQWETAKRADVSETCLSRIENGRSTPTPSVAARLATVLGVPPEQIFAEQAQVPGDEAGISLITGT